MLTNTKIKNLKPTGKLYRELDSLGLYIEVGKSGNKIWRQRIYIQGKENMLTLGIYPETSLLDARQARDHNKQLIRLGNDPSKKNTVNTVYNSSKITFNEMFISWHKKMSKKKWSEKYSESVQQRADRHLLPYIGDKSIEDITTDEMRKVLEPIEERDLIDTLHKIKGIASRVFSHSINKYKGTNNPVSSFTDDDFELPDKNTHYSTITNPKEIGALLRVIDTYKWSRSVGTALKLAPHLFLRPGELAGLMWKEVDFDDEIIRIAPERMKMKRTHLVPMSRQTMALLNSIKTSSYSEFVFISPKSRTRHITPESLRAGLRSLGFTNDDITTHGFRHMASTRLNELEFRDDVIERQLAHTENNKVKAAYNHAEYLQERIDMMQKWSDYLDKLKNH